MDRRDFFALSGAATLGAFVPGGGISSVDMFGEDIVGEDLIKQFGAAYYITTEMMYEKSVNEFIKVLLDQLRESIYTFMCEAGYTLATNNPEIREPIGIYWKQPGSAGTGFIGDMVGSIGVKAYGRMPTPANLSFMTQRAFDVEFEKATMPMLANILIGRQKDATV